MTHDQLVAIRIRDAAALTEPISTRDWSRGALEVSRRTAVADRRALLLALDGMRERLIKLGHSPWGDQ